MSEGYNGWNNYETWLVNLWYTNDEYSYSRLQDAQAEAREDFDEAYPDYVPGKADDDQDLTDARESAINELADMLKDMVEADCEETVGCAGFITDLVNAALSEVDWREWAENLLEI
jgi:hypothetical protein